MDLRLYELTLVLDPQLEQNQTPPTRFERATHGLGM